jgi:hypothetical protein
VQRGPDQSAAERRRRAAGHETSSLQGLHRHRDITMSSDEYDRDWWIRIGKLVLQIETAQSRQSYVEDEAPR